LPAAASCLLISWRFCSEWSRRIRKRGLPAARDCTRADPIEPPAPVT